ncbi:MAG: alpha/beta fold hydrolase [Thermoleophilaceae bacterium]|nr:alpha/beta fold hydrolase [Thermoleophilaceae bacterium]
MSEISRVISKDGTSIAYERVGKGPAVILVTGGLDDGSENAPLATELAESFTAYNYNRRGRGESGDTLPYALDREIEDIEARVAEAGGSAHLYGVSSGGALALEAAAAGVAIDKLAVYEVPYNMADDWPQRWGEYVEQSGRRSPRVAAVTRSSSSCGWRALPKRRSRGQGTRRIGPAWRPLPTHSSTTRPAWEMASRPPPAWQRSRSRPWSPLAARTHPERRAGSSPSTRPPTRSPAASRVRDVRLSRVSRT